MKRSLIGLLSTVISSFTFANYTVCPQAVPASNPTFCASFKAVAACHCTSSGLPSSMCNDMNAIYSRMISIFGSVQKACAYQKDTTTRICIDDWNCYRYGGVDSYGNLCSSTGRAC